MSEKKRNSKRWVLLVLLVLLLLLLFGLCSRRETAGQTAGQLLSTTRQATGEEKRTSEPPMASLAAQVESSTAEPSLVEVVASPTPDLIVAPSGHITVLEPTDGSVLLYPNYDFTFSVDGVSPGGYGIWIAGIGQSMFTMTAFPPCIPGVTEVCRAEGGIVYYHSSIYWGPCGLHPNGTLICEENFGLDEVYHLTATLLALDTTCTQWIQEYKEDQFNFRGECVAELDQADIVLGSGS